MKKIFFSAFLILVLIVSCKKGTGKMIFKMEAETSQLSPADSKLIEAIYQKRLQTYGIDDDDISIKTNGKIFDIEISEISNYTENSLERLSKLFVSSAHLGFWETYTLQEIAPALNKCFENDSVRKSELLKFIAQAPSNDPKSCCMFYVLAKDTIGVNKILSDWQSMKFFPKDLRFRWSAKSDKNIPGAFGLITLKATFAGTARLDRPKMTKVHLFEDKYSGSASPEISMEMDDVNSEVWKRMTRENFGKAIAIVVDDYVYSYPTVQGEITGGTTTITGDFTQKEAEDLVALLKTEPMPVSMRIVEKNFVR